ncbi:hypothetical protein [Lewinella sp. IMCC34183]|uniref:hypothetical protein n=1 Tax=Lewinella sp. IMCC34183 TaxID=2248762 RepID=UPI0018E5225C|nr:hypothetical protein [Lewinella sp. IMCC34183]
MAEQQPTTFEEFYRKVADSSSTRPVAVEGRTGTIGRFGVFDLEELYRGGEPLRMPYNRRTYTIRSA